MKLRHRFRLGENTSSKLNIYSACIKILFKIKYCFIWC
jgi:hypothetical protein